jgi:hypothetical protein
MSFPFENPDFKPEVIHQIDDRLHNTVIVNSRYNRHRRQKRKKIKLFLIGLVLIGLILLVSFLFTNQANHKNSKKIITPTIITSLKYDSRSSSIIFHYPSNWRVFNNHHGLIEITSPISKILNQNKQLVNGKVKVTINQTDVVPPAFGNFAIAVLNSKIVNYTNPTSLQRKQTYLTFAQYSEDSVVGSLNAIYLTGGFGYEFKQVIPIGDMEKLSPLIFISFEQCSNKTCSNLKPMIVNDSFVNQLIVDQQAYGIVESIQIT